MGFITGTIRLLYLQQVKSSLEHKILLITEAQMDLSNSLNELNNVGTDLLDPDSPVLKAMKAKRDKIAIVEKELNRKMTMYQTKLKAVEQEIREASGMVKQNVRHSFSYGMGHGGD